MLVTPLWSRSSSDDKSDSNPAEGSGPAETEESSDLQGKLLSIYVRQGETLLSVANGGVGSSPVDSQLTERLTEVAFQKVF